MELETTRFGSITIEPDAVITLTQPILGFQDYRRFILLPGPSAYLTWLQSVDSGELAFLLLDPSSVVNDYRINIRQQELSELAVTAISELEVYTLVVVPNDPAKIRTNLKAPILINRQQRLGKQTIMDASDYPIQYFLAQPPKGPEPTEEVSNAGTDA